MKTISLIYSTLAVFKSNFLGNTWQQLKQENVEFKWVKTVKMWVKKSHKLLKCINVQYLYFVLTTYCTLRLYTDITYVHLTTTDVYYGSSIRESPHTAHTPHHSLSKIDSIGHERELEEDSIGHHWH